MSIAEAQKLFRQTLAPLYDEREARAITALVLQHLLEVSATTLSLDRFRLLTTHQQAQLQSILNRLQTAEPVQYVLGEAYFGNLKLKVNPHVLIPRPETEELVHWVAQTAGPNYSGHLLDVGTGSGCIAIALAKQLPQAQVAGVDISEQALQVAADNSLLHNAGVTFKRLDILSQPLPANTYGLIVSNPPYITPAESEGMAANVLQHEPHTALFVTNADALQFYRAIAHKALTALLPGGYLFFEINAAYGPATVELLQQMGYTQIELRRDLSGRDRMLKAVKPTA